MAHDVFICHSSEDKVYANAACAKLEAAGIRCWIAPRDPIPGLPYPRQLVEAISRSRILLLIFSENANRSNAILNEVELAANREVVILPFRIADVLPNEDLEYYIRKVHWIDAMSPPFEQRLDELAELVKRLLASLPPKPDGAPNPPSDARKMTAATAPMPELASVPSTPPTTPPPPREPPRADEPARFDVVTTVAGGSAARGAALTFSYNMRPGQPEREQVELLDAQDVTHSVRVYERRHVADQISGRFYLPHAAATGPNARLRVTTWDAAGMPIAGFSAPFTVGGAAAGTGGPKVAPALMLAAAGALVAVVLIGHWIWSALAGHGRPLPSAVPPPIALASPRAVASAGPSRTVATPVPWGRFATLRVLPALTFRGGCEPLGSGTFVQRIEFHNGSRSPISINYDLDPAGAHRPNYERYGVYLPPGAQIEGAADLKPGTCAAGSTFWYDAVRAQSSPQRFATDSVRADQIPHNVNFSRPHDPRLWSDWAKVIRQPRIAFSSHCDIAPGGSRISLRFRNDAEVAVSFNYGINMSKTTAPDPFEHGIVIGPRQLSYAAVFTIPGRCGDWELWTQNFDYGT